MNTQASVSLLRKSLHLQDLVSAMTLAEKMEAAEIIRSCDIARLLKNTSIHKELKLARDGRTGKMKRFIAALAKNKYAMSGVDVLFERAK